MIRPFAVLSTLVFSLVVLVGLQGCSLVAKKIVKEPKVALRGLQVREVGPAGATVVFLVRVDNPNAFGITVDTVRYQAEIAGKEVASGRITEPAAIAASGSSQVEIPVPVKYAVVFDSLIGFLQAGKSSYRVKGEAAVGLLSVPFDHQGEFNLKNDSKIDLGE